MDALADLMGLTRGELGLLAFITFAVVSTPAWPWVMRRLLGVPDVAPAPKHSAAAGELGPRAAERGADTAEASSGGSADLARSSVAAKR